VPGVREHASTSIRAAAPDDAGPLLELKRALDRESTFMLLEPDERRTTEPDERMHLEAVGDSPNSTVLVAEHERRLVGYVEASGGEFRRNRSTAHVVIGVRRAYAGQGIGSRLLARLEQWALSAGVRRLELTVMTHNQAAIGLYRKLGYEREGARRAALVIDGKPVDELWMAKLVSR
jgi:RimJ/RimL family protein N-acetyltransferase